MGKGKRRKTKPPKRPPAPSRGQAASAIWRRREAQGFHPVLRDVDELLLRLEAGDDGNGCRGLVVQHLDGSEGGCELGERCIGGDHYGAVECSSDWPPDCAYCAALICSGTVTEHRLHRATECSQGEGCASRDWHRDQQDCTTTYPGGCWYCDSEPPPPAPRRGAPRLTRPRS